MYQTLIENISGIGRYILLILRVFIQGFKNPPHANLIRDQLYSVGVASLPVVAITGFSTGIVLAAQAHFQLADFGLTSVTGLMVAKAMMVELGPVLTAFMITGRVGASMCAELGTMKVTEQIDAIMSMDVDPLRYLLAPRFFAGIIMLPLLTIFSTFMGIFGGYAVSVHYYNMDSNAYFDPIQVHLDNFDFISGLVKATVFGIIIITICCYKGMTTKGGAQGVGKFTTNSVVICYIVILVVNFFITIMLNNSYHTLQNWFPNLIR